MRRRLQGPATVSIVKVKGHADCTPRGVISLRQRKNLPTETLLCASVAVASRTWLFI